MSDIYHMRCSREVFVIRPEQPLRAAVTDTTRLGHIETEFFKAFRRVILFKFINSGHFQAVVQVPFDQRGDQQNLLSKVTPNQHTARFLEDVVSLGVLTHVLANIVSRNHGVYENWAEFFEFRFELFRCFNVAQEHAKECSILHLSDDFFLCQITPRLDSLQSIDKLLFRGAGLVLVHPLALVILHQVLDAAAQIR